MKIPEPRLNSILFAGVAAALLGACGTPVRRDIRRDPDHVAGRGRSDGGVATTLDGGMGGRNATGGRSPGGDAGGYPGNRIPDLLGEPCLESSDCGPLLRCVTASSTDFGGDGVANGLCTLDCTDDLRSPIPAESVCAVLDPTALCLEVAATALCSETCTIGPVTSAIDKCNGRSDFACTRTLPGADTYCVPACRGDFDCSGRRCDLRTGTCRDRIEPGRTLPTGAKCDPDAAVDRCEGVCVGITPTTGFCSGYCSLGSELNCNVDPLSTDPVGAFCLYGSTEASDHGDLGFCGQLCDCNEECANLDFVCLPVVGLDAIAGRTGACGPPSSDAPVGIPCR